MKNNHNRVKNQKYKIVVLALSSMIMAVIFYCILCRGESSLAISRSTRSNIVSDCSGSAPDSVGSNVDQVCGEFDNGTSNEASNFSSSDNIRATGNTTNVTGGIISAQMTSTTYNYGNLYSNSNMKSTVTSASCSIVNQYNQAVAPCSVSGAVGADTGSYYYDGTGGWRNSDGAANVDIIFDENALGKGNYKAVIKTNGVVSVNGVTKGYSTGQTSEISFSVGEKQSIDKIATPDETQPDPYQWNFPDIDKITVQGSNHYYLYAVVSCKPTISTSYDYQNYDENGVPTNLYILQKDEREKIISASVNVNVSYGEKPKILYGPEVLNDMKKVGDVDWTTACSGSEHDSRSINTKVELENGELVTETNNEEKSPLTAETKRVVYQRRVDVTCSSDSGCSYTVGTLAEYSDDQAKQDMIDDFTGFLGNVWTFIENLLKNTTSCLSNSNVTSQEGIVNKFLAFTNCLINAEVEDGESLSAIAGAFGNALSFASDLSGTIQDNFLNSWLTGAVTQEVPIPELMIVAYRIAEASLGLDAEMTVKINSNEVGKISTTEMLHDSKTEQRTMDDKIYYGNGVISVDSQATIHRVPYENNRGITRGGWNKDDTCNDHTGCDKPKFDDIDSFVYPKLEVVNNNIVATEDTDGLYAKLGTIGKKPSDFTKEDINPRNETTDSYSVTHESITEPPLGTVENINKTFSTADHITINYSDDIETPALEATLGAEIRRPWNYRLSFKQETSNIVDGIIVSSEDGINITTTIKNESNTYCDGGSPRVNGMLISCTDNEEAKNNEQEGVPSDSPATTVSLYLVNITTTGKTANQIKTMIEEIDKTAHGPIASESRTILKESNQTVSFSVNINDSINVGSHLCYYFGMNYTDSIKDGMYESGFESYDPTGRSPHRQNMQYSNVICATVAALPTTQVEGGSFYSNGGKITTKVIKPSASSNVFGSWVEYGIVSKGKVYGLSSGKGLPNISTTEDYNVNVSSSDHPLTITNDNAHMMAQRNSLALESYIEGLGEASINLPVSTEKLNNLKNSTNANYQYIDTSTISGSETIEKCTIIYRNDGDIEITGNIEARTCTGGIAQTLIIANGNIKIHDNVQKINAWLIAGGEIDTCGNIDSEDKINSDRHTHNRNTCNQQLMINGPVFANNIKLDRTYINAPDTMAEKFDIGPSTYFWIYEQTSGDSGYNEAYSKSLAPRY